MENEVLYQFLDLKPIIIEDKEVVPEILLGLDYGDSDYPKGIDSVHLARMRDLDGLSFYGRIHYFFRAYNSIYTVKVGTFLKLKILRKV